MTDRYPALGFEEDVRSAPPAGLPRQAPVGATALFVYDVYEQPLAHVSGSDE